MSSLRSIIVSFGAIVGLIAAVSCSVDEPTLVPSDLPPQAAASSELGDDADTASGAADDSDGDDSDSGSGEVGTAPPLPTPPPNPTTPPAPSVDDATDTLGGPLDPTRHGQEAVEAACPGVEFRRIEASVFTFAVPADFVDSGEVGFDSEVGVFGNGEAEMFFDYGNYSEPLSERGYEVTPLDFSGIAGEYSLVGGPSWLMMSTHLGPVEDDASLSMSVTFADSEYSRIAGCILQSVEWLVDPAG